MNISQSFRNLHRKEKPLVLFNTWDARSSWALKEQGINIQATGSFGIAHVLGLEDGENITFSELIDIVGNMNSFMLLLDFESGYSSTCSGLTSNVNSIIKKNVVGINIEDKFPHADSLMGIDEFTRRISIIKDADTCNKLFINARTDMFFSGDIDEKNQNAEVLEQCIYRIKEYEKVGVDSIFIPGLKNKQYIQKISSEVNILINIMLDIRTDKLEDYLDIGISSFCYGPSIYFDWLEKNIPLETYFTNLLTHMSDLSTNNRITINFQGEKNDKFKR